jgi:hypothetical protein
MIMLNSLLQLTRLKFQSLQLLLLLSPPPCQ